MMIKRAFEWIVFIALAGYAVSLWQGVPVPCATPIEYSLGQFDARSGISQEEFLKQAAAGEKAWEDAQGRELFRYVPDAPFKVNLIFDERQERTLDAQKLADSLEKTQATQESLEQKQDRVSALYAKEKKAYEALLADFKRRLAEYNAGVEKWNRQGGAPKDEYERLQDEAKALERLQKKLEAARESVNALATEVNKFSRQQVQAVDRYNDQVEGYVNRYGNGSDEFDQGDYIGDAINIYQFDDLAHLRVVLAHEFGHALGIGHVENPRSIMYHLMRDQDLQRLALTAEDRAALEIGCSLSRSDIFLEKAKLLIEKMKQL